MTSFVKKYKRKGILRKYEPTVFWNNRCNFSIGASLDNFLLVNSCSAFFYLDFFRTENWLAQFAKICITIRFFHFLQNCFFFEVTKPSVKKSINYSGLLSVADHSLIALLAKYCLSTAPWAEIAQKCNEKWSSPKFEPSFLRFPYRPVKFFQKISTCKKFFFSPWVLILAIKTWFAIIAKKLTSVWFFGLKLIFFQNNQISFIKISFVSFQPVKC